MLCYSTVLCSCSKDLAISGGGGCPNGQQLLPAVDTSAVRGVE